MNRENPTTENPQNQIKLYRVQGQGWMAVHRGPCVRELMDLFGTDTLPTAFTDNAEPEMVLAEIQRLNPGYRVVLNSTQFGGAL